MKISVKNWGLAPDGNTVQLFTLDDENGHIVRISNLGGIVQSIEVPDREGVSKDVILGFDDVDGYIKDDSYQAAAIGRFGNRIGGGRFSIDGVPYQVTQNEGENCLHGGKPGFNGHVWKATAVKGQGFVGVDMNLFSPDGDQGFPGNVDVNIHFRLTDKRELSIAYEATTDKATPLNLTHHMYYNLSGDSKKDILGNELMIRADRRTPVNSKMVPTGEIVSVEGTPFDFRTPTLVGLRIDADDQQLKYGGGYDHNVVFVEADGSLKNQAELFDPASGRVMEVLTTEPAVQFYAGNSLSGAKGKMGLPNLKRHALCLETQHYPDAPNHANFPDTILRPGDSYRSQTVMRFSVR